MALERARREDRAPPPSWQVQMAKDGDDGAGVLDRGDNLEPATAVWAVAQLLELATLIGTTAKPRMQAEAVGIGTQGRHRRFA